MWFVYLIRVKKSGALYCGITNNLEGRIKAHREGKGAKYLRGKGEISLAWFMSVEDRSKASRLEANIKKLGKKAKEALVSAAPEPFYPTQQN